jgi:signal transduction histidine kinase
MTNNLRRLFANLSGFRNTAPIALVVVALVGSVAVPARQTWMISGLLHETTETLAPARLLASQLHAGLAEELALLRAPRSGAADSALTRFRVLADSDDRRMASLFVLSQHLDTASAARIDRLGDRIAAWRGIATAAIDVNTRVLEGEGPMRALVQAHGAVLDAVSDVDEQLRVQAAVRDLRLGELDRVGLGWNVVLVMAALAALFSVALLMAREHRSLAETQARAAREAAMRDRLERVLQSRSRLIRGFSHDVKNPIGAADGYAALLAEGVYGELTPDQRESVQRLRRSIRVALTLILDLHELVAAETGHLQLKMEPVDIGSLVETLVDDYRASARAASLGLEGHVDRPPAIVTSATRVRQIVANLISNAIKYSERGVIHVRAGAVAHGPDRLPGAWIRVDVTDEGPGIPHDKQEFIFEEFGRIAPAGKPGAGLGLAISRLLAQALGGQLTVASTVGSGSTFTLWLPARRGEDAVAASASPLEPLALGFPHGAADRADARPHRMEEEPQRQDL